MKKQFLLLILFFFFLIDKEIYTEAKNIWLENLKNAKENIRILENGANFFFISESEISGGLYIKLQELKNNNPNYYEKLGQIYSLKIKRLAVLIEGGRKVDLYGNF